MKRNGIILIATLAVFLLAGQSFGAGVIMSAASPQASGSEIDGSSAFQIDIYIANEGPTSGTTDWCGGSFSFGFYSPDGSIEDITHVNVAGDPDIPSIQYLGSFTSYFGFIMHEDLATKMDGTLPDYANMTPVGSGCMPNTVTSTAFIRFNVQVDYSTTGTTGQLCIDSVNSADSGGDMDWDWLIEDRFQPTFSGPYCWTITNLTPSDVKLINEDSDVLPDDFSLEQNYPNPFNPSTSFDFALPKLSQVNIEIFNVLGQKIKTLADAEYPAGKYKVNWDGTDEEGSSVASGIYFYRMNAEGFQDTKKLMLLK